MVIEGSGSMHFTAVKRVYNSAHLEPTKGGRKLVIEYIHKEPPFDEKGEEIIAFTSYGLYRVVNFLYQTAMMLCLKYRNSLMMIKHQMKSCD